MRFHSILLIVAFAVPSLAVRGDVNKRRNASPRSLQVGAAKVDPKAAPVAPSKADPKEDPAAAANKVDPKADPKMDPKGDKKKCKKAKKQKGKKKEDGRRRGRGRGRGRSLQLEPKAAGGPPAPPVGPEEVRYCLHREFAEGECANVKALPKGGKVQGGLNIELVHNDDESSESILERVQEILWGDDTNARYVGCQDMKAPPPPPKKKDGRRVRRRAASARSSSSSEYATTRHLEYTLVDEEHDIVDVTGVDFKNVKIDKSACAVTDGTGTMACDVIKSTVEIYFHTEGDDELSAADKQDMYDLLAETILAQSEAGTFASVGEVTYVEAAPLDSDDDGSRTTSDENAYGNSNSDNKKEGSGSIPIIVPIAAVAAIAGGAYYYTSSKDGDGEKPEQDTSDSEDDEQRMRQASQ